MVVRILPVFAMVALAFPSPTRAQIRASEAAVVSQTVDGTVITVSYSRPQLRGRPPGTDGIIHMEHMWTPGANWATTFEASRPIELNGHAIAAGKYSFWAEPSDSTWTVHLHPEPRLFHTAAPKTGEMVVSLTVTPERAQDRVEMLTFDFPEVRQDGATLRFRWAQVLIPFDISVKPSRKAVAMTEEQAAPYVGGWLVQFLNEVNEKSPEMRMEILLANGVLRGVMDGPQPFGVEFLPEPEPHTFVLAFMMNEQVFDVEANSPIIFEVQNGRASRWYAKAVPGIGDEPWIWGKRRP